MPKRGPRSNRPNANLQLDLQALLSSSIRSTARTPIRPGASRVDSYEHAGALRALGIPDLSDPDWKTASRGPAGHRLCCSGVRPDPRHHPIAGRRPGPGRPARRTRRGSRLPPGQRPDRPRAPNSTAKPQTPPPKDITVKLPAGLAISPSSADGLEGCSDQTSDPAGDQVHYDNTEPVTCPNSAKIGSAVATSPLLATHDPVTDEVNGPDPIPGDVYLLKPHPGDLPVGGKGEGKFRLLIELENERYGVNIKLPGLATADPETGQLTTVFTQNPQLPASHITVSLKEGPRAPLMTPVTCGSFRSTSDLVPWETPEVPDAEPVASINVGSGPNGSGCPASAAARPFAPTISAGTEFQRRRPLEPLHPADRPARRGQGARTLDLTLPEGLSAKLAGVPACSEDALKAAEGRSGAAEQASPSCPASRSARSRSAPARAPARSSPTAPPTSPAPTKARR